MAPAALPICPPAAEPLFLPDGSSPDLQLVHATPEEAIHCALLNFKSWSGPLSQQAYLRREAHLAATEASLNGGLSGWILVDSKDTKSPRTILAACESLRKRALIAQRGCPVKEVQTYGIGSVYCREEYRGKGYALRMMAELRKKLEDWNQRDGTKTDFTVLFSDIGKRFYAKNGWIPYASSHILLKANASAASKQLQVRKLRPSDLPQLCKKDEQMLRHTVAQFPAGSPNIRVALIPSSQTMGWHHAREEFLAQELTGRKPEIKGAQISSSSGHSVWCIWTRVFARENGENALFVLRLVIEDEDGTSGEPAGAESVAAVAACLAAAQEEAAAWGMDNVQIWNPSPTARAAAKVLDPATKVVEREEESIACLNWYGDNPGPDNVQWVANEKFGWC